MKKKQDVQWLYSYFTRIFNIKFSKTLQNLHHCINLAETVVVIFLFFTMYLSVFMIRYDMIFQKCMQYWLIRSFFVCDSYCDTDQPFIMVISDDPWHSHLLPSVWQWSLSFYVFYCWWWNWISNNFYFIRE